MPAARLHLIALLAATIFLTWEVRPVLAETTLGWKFKNGDKISYVIEVKQATKLTIGPCVGIRVTGRGAPLSGDF
jgi:hypothetical protein